MQQIAKKDHYVKDSRGKLENESMSAGTKLPGALLVFVGLIFAFYTMNGLYSKYFGIWILYDLFFSFTSTIC
jgi:pheromone shutdown protein TraB